jgi:putative membrane protein
MCLMNLFGELAACWPGLLALYWDGNGGWHMMPGTGWGMGAWGMGMGWIGMLVGIAFWVLIFLALVYLIKYLIQATGRPGRPPESERKTPLDILKERYARGEIDKEEFDSKKKDLSD